jgi:hypothetical protein
VSTPEPVGEAAEVWAAQLDMYEGFTTGDRPRIDRHISSDGTMWDSAHEDLIYGLEGLNVVRAARPTGPDSVQVTGLTAFDPVITVWGDVALSRHLLTVTFSDPEVPDERVRNTGVWRRIDGEWLNVHNHEDVLP